MHILFTANGYKPAYRVGGPIHTVSATAEGLVARGHRVTVLTTNSNNGEDLDVETDVPTPVDGVSVWYFKREPRVKMALPFLSRCLNAESSLYAPKMHSALAHILPTVDVVHTQMPFIYPTYVAGREAIRRGIPLFYSQHGVLDPARLKFRRWKKWLYLHLFERQLLRKAACLISLTDAETAAYRALGVTAPCEVVPNGVHTGDHWQTVPNRWQERLGIDPDAQVVLFMGRLHPIKGADRLIRAFVGIHKAHPKAILVCAGPDEVGLQDQLLALVEGHTAAMPPVRFPGMVSGDDKKALLARADLFCLPSEAEGFSMAVLEAMASKTAVLLSPGCHFDRVAEAGAGVVVPNDTASVARALNDLLTDDRRLKTMGTAALELVQNEYRWEPIVDKLDSLYERFFRLSRERHARISYREFRTDWALGVPGPRRTADGRRRGGQGAVSGPARSRIP